MNDLLKVEFQQIPGEQRWREIESRFDSESDPQAKRIRQTEKRTWRALAPDETVESLAALGKETMQMSANPDIWATPEEQP